MLHSCHYRVDFREFSKLEAQWAPGKSKEEIKHNADAVIETITSSEENSFALAEFLFAHGVKPEEQLFEELSSKVQQRPLVGRVLKELTGLVSDFRNTPITTLTTWALMAPIPSYDEAKVVLSQLTPAQCNIIRSSDGCIAQIMYNCASFWNLLRHDRDGFIEYASRFATLNLIQWSNYDPERYRSTFVSYLACAAVHSTAGFALFSQVYDKFPATSLRNSIINRLETWSSGQCHFSASRFRLYVMVKRKIPGIIEEMNKAPIYVDRAKKCPQDVLRDSYAHTEGEKMMLQVIEELAHLFPIKRAEITQELSGLFDEKHLIWGGIADYYANDPKELLKSTLELE